MVLEKDKAIKPVIFWDFFSKTVPLNLLQAVLLQYSIPICFSSSKHTVNALKEVRCTFFEFIGQLS
jgi:hypothetical protein